MRERIKDRELDAVCMFGPGSGYRRKWPPGVSGVGGYDSAGVFGEVGLVLAWAGRELCEIMGRLGLCHKRAGGGTVMVSEVQEVGPIRLEAAGAGGARATVRSWGGSDDPTCKAREVAEAHDEPRDVGGVAVGGSGVVDRRVPRQQWLFPDYAGAGGVSGVKRAASRVRPRRSPRATNKAPVGREKQGVLFDA